MATGRRPSASTCIHCGGAVQSDWKFCRACGQAASAARCGSCGEILAPAARFCRACGQAAGVAHCPSCGAELLPGARFCPACGAGTAVATPPVAPAQPSAPIASWPVPIAKPVRRTPLPRAVALGGGLLVAGVLAVGGWALFLRGGGGDDSGGGGGGPANVQEAKVAVLEPAAAGAVDPKLGLPPRGHVRLDHPEGASADVPGGAVLYGDAMDLRRVELAPDPWWEHGGKGWEFVSFTGIPIEETVTVDLPAGANAGKVIVRSASLFWVELPAQAVTLKNGQPGLRVTVADVPAPWTFAIATPKADAAEITADEQDEIRVAGLYWTDRAAWEQETIAWLKANPPTSAIPDGRLASARPALRTPSQDYDRIRAQVRFTIRLFDAARVGVAPDVTVAGGGIAIPGVGLTGEGVWAAGVQRLAAVKENWLTLRATLVTNWEMRSAEYQLAVLLMDDWIESAMFDYTPWGIDFVKGLLDTGELKGFDMRALKPYGELKWTDLQLKAGDMPAVDESAAQILAGETKAPIAGLPKYDRVMRLYSVRAMERLTIIDWFKENVDWIVRWLPVVIVGAGMVGGVVLIPGAVGLSLFWASVDQILNWVQDWYTKGEPSPYAYMMFEGVSAGGVGGASFIMDMVEERALMSAEARPMLPEHGLTIAQFAYSVGMFMAVRNTDWYTFKTIRGVNAGTRGYCRARCDQIAGAIPPVVVHVRAAGMLEQPAGAYPAGVDRLMAYRVEFGAMDYHKDWLEGHRTTNGALADLPVTEYGQGAWPVVVQRTTPQYQNLRIGIPKAAIPPEVWGNRPADAPLSEFGATLTLTSAGGDSTKIALKEPAGKLASDNADTFYVAVRLRNTGSQPLGGYSAFVFEKGYDAPPAQEGEMDGSHELRAKLTGTVDFADSRANSLAFDVDFTTLPARQALILDMSADEPLMRNDQWVRVQYATVNLSADILGAYQLTRWQYGGGEAPLTEVYLRGDLFPFGRICETNPGVCELHLSKTPGTGGRPEHSVATICGPDPNPERVGLFCRPVADSYKWKELSPNTTALPPTVHENFYTMAGPILTGSGEYGAAWDPGEPAIIWGWNEITAEFKDGKVTGTIVAGQFIWDTENAKRINERTVTVRIVFEATKKK